MTNLLKGLNTPQKDAVKANKGPFLVIAGAGSGKTTALTRRVAYLILERKVYPHNILAVTFTNKAAKEMKQRISDLIGIDNIVPLVGTFHSVCVKILRNNISNLHYSSDFTILDTQDTQAIIRKKIKELKLPSKKITPRMVLNKISHAKNLLLTPKDIALQVKDNYDKDIANIYDKYQEYLFKSNSLDFDDLIRLTIKLFKQFPEILESYQKRFKYVLVDEYQDTNYAQYTFINLLAKNHKNIFVVGDDWQSIYKWRGADINNILDFEKDYSGAKIIKLEQNYRSTQIILDAAYYVIKENNKRTNKKIWTNQREGQKIIVFEASNESQEAAYISKKILEYVEDNKKTFNDFVVLYRTNAQSRVIEEYFLKNDIPYRIVGGIKFYARKEIKDIIAYLKLIKNPYDQTSLFRILDAVKIGIGEKTIDKWIIGSNRYNMDFITFALSEKLEEFITVSSRRQKIKYFSLFIRDIKKNNIDLDVSLLIRHVYDNSGYKSIIIDGTEEGNIRDENIKELLSVSSKYKNMDNQLNLFLEEVALASDSDTILENLDNVHLMTLHSAKGLEFPIVFIIGLEEGLLPHVNSIKNESELEEERRLMYVGITRAKEEVFLLYANQRMLFGNFKINLPSRFINDIPSKLIEKDIARGSMILLGNPKKKESSIKDIYKISKENQTDIKKGMKVIHAQFGIGVVLYVDKDTVSIIFKGRAIKKLSRTYAQLTIAE